MKRVRIQNDAQQMMFFSFSLSLNNNKNTIQSILTQVLTNEFLVFFLSLVKFTFTLFIEQIQSATEQKMVGFDLFDQIKANTKPNVFAILIHLPRKYRKKKSQAKY